LAAVPQPSAWGVVGLGDTFDCSVSRRLLCVIDRSDAIVRAAALDLAVETFMPSDANVTTKYGNPSVGGS
jgi:hypothetical protein